MSGITFVTGLPGHGKTLNTIAEIDREWAGKRPIYYLWKEAVDIPGAGIAGLNLDHWEPFDDPTKWWECPDGSVIVIDECQYCFPRRGNVKGKEPEYISAFTEHRKKGFDIYLITQDAKNVDHFIRRLSDRHIHWWRPFGASRSTRWEYPRVVDPFDKRVQSESTSRRVVKHPSVYFGAYASANVHTVKRRIPKKLFLIPGALAVVVGGAAFAVSSLQSSVSEPETKALSVQATPAPVREAVSSLVTNNKPAAFADGRITGVVEYGHGQGVALLDVGGRPVRRHISQCRYSDGRWECEYQGSIYVQESAPKPQSGEQAKRAAWLGG